MRLKELLDELQYSDPEFYLSAMQFDIACDIKNLMKKHGLSKEDIAKRANIPDFIVESVLSGQVSSLTVIAKVLAAIGDPYIRLRITTEGGRKDGCVIFEGKKNSQKT